MTITPQNADVIFLTNDTNAVAQAKPRFQMYEAECSRLGLSVAILSASEDTAADTKKYALPDMQMWRQNLNLYDRLFENDRALIISDGVGRHALGLIMTQAWRANRVLVDYSAYNLMDADSGYTSIKKFFPSMGAQDLLGTIAHHAVMCVATSKPLYDILIDHSPNVSIVPTGYASGIFPAYKPRQPGIVKITWLGTVNTLDDAKEPLLAIELLNHLPAEIQQHVELHVIGSGALWKSLPDHIEPTALVCKFHDRPEDHALANLLTEMSVGLALPSNTVEGVTREGRDCIAMMLAGIPVCALKQGEPGRLVVDGKTGSVNEKLDDFKNTLEALITDHAVREKMGALVATEAQRDYAYGFEGAKLDAIIEAAYAGDTRHRNHRHDAWITSDSHPHLFTQTPLGYVHVKKAV